jgi:hypothetical protein
MNRVLVAAMLTFPLINGPAAPADAEPAATPVPKQRKQLLLEPPQVRGTPLSVIDVLLAGDAGVEDIPRARVCRDGRFNCGKSVQLPPHLSIHRIEIGNLGASVPVCRATMKHGATRDVAALWSKGSAITTATITAVG